MHGVIVWILQKQYLELKVEMMYKVLLIKSLPINLAPESANHLTWTFCNGMHDHGEVLSWILIFKLYLLR